MTAVRERLPNRRPGRTSEIDVAGRRYCVTVSNFADGCDRCWQRRPHRREKAPRRAKNGAPVRFSGGAASSQGGGS
jgi:hypothetical protein